MTDTQENAPSHEALNMAERRLSGAVERIETLIRHYDEAKALAAGAREEAEQRVAVLEAEVAALMSKVQSQEEMLTKARAGLTGKSDLKARIAKLETENLALHEQVAAAALAGPDGDAEVRAALASVKAEKKMLEDRYASLKQEFASAGGTQQSAELVSLKETLARYERDREDMRSTLDLGIARLEGVLKAGEA